MSPIDIGITCVVVGTMSAVCGFFFGFGNAKDAENDRWEKMCVSRGVGGFHIEKNDWGEEHTHFEWNEEK